MGKDQVIITIILFNLFFILFIAGIIVFIRQYKIKKKEHNTMLQTQQESHKQELLATQIEIQQQTMQHIGREIHDNIGQKLTLASLYTQQLAFENKAPHIKDNIENISAIINQSLSELRQLSKSLTDNTIEENSIDALLTNECKKIIELKKCAIIFSNNNKNLDLDYRTKTILLRITQEFIQNSVKHSKCKNIEIKLNEVDDHLQLTLQDDGKGFDTQKSYNGIGLSNMKKRTELLGGNYTMNSNNTGTTLSVNLPYFK